MEREEGDVVVQEREVAPPSPPRADRSSRPSAPSAQPAGGEPAATTDLEDSKAALQAEYEAKAANWADTRQSLISGYNQIEDLIDEYFPGYSTAANQAVEARREAQRQAGVVIAPNAPYINKKHGGGGAGRGARCSQRAASGRAGASGGRRRGGQGRAAGGVGASRGAESGGDVGAEGSSDGGGNGEVEQPDGVGDDAVEQPDGVGAGLGGDDEVEQPDGVGAGIGGNGDKEQSGGVGAEKK
nr:glycine-rich RNA-binding protein-like [Aegilops tauschii subsp. strangulata]